MDSLSEVSSRVDSIYKRLEFLGHLMPTYRFGQLVLACATSSLLNCRHGLWDISASDMASGIEDRLSYSRLNPPTAFESLKGRSDLFHPGLRRTLIASLKRAHSFYPALQFGQFLNLVIWSAQLEQEDLYGIEDSDLLATVVRHLELLESGKRSVSHEDVLGAIRKVGLRHDTLMLGNISLMLSLMCGRGTGNDHRLLRTAQAHSDYWERQGPETAEEKARNTNPLTDFKLREDLLIALAEVWKQYSALPFLALIKLVNALARGPKGSNFAVSDAELLSAALRHIEDIETTLGDVE